MSASEFDIIRQRFQARVRPDAQVPVGIGDDGAVLNPGQGEHAWVVDTINEGVHFTLGSPGRAVGHRTLAVNLSDMVAMGAAPRWALMSLSLPEPDGVWLDDFCDGFFELAEQAGTHLAGGDLTRGSLAVTVTLLGPLYGERVLRSGARPGDRVLVSGTLGDARGGLEQVRRGASGPDPDQDRLVDRYRFPQPRLELAPLLPGRATAAIDVSDGLAADAGHIAEASGVGMELDGDAVPLSSALRAIFPDQAREYALYGGDDYEILCTVPAEGLTDLMESAAAAGINLTEVGEVVAGSGVRLAGEPVGGSGRRAGHDHFRDES